ncbi:MAG: hypothetical protein ABW000_15825 [Actinoplanes sp.]
MAYAKYTREMLSEAVAASTSMAGVLRYLGMPQNGGAHAHLRRRVDKLGIDTSHFLGSGHLRGVPHPSRRTAAEILVLRPQTGSREKPPALRRALTEIGRPYLCAECGIGETWNGRPLVLQVDHIDGQMWDCRPENVRFLCPNCHSQTATYAGRNRPRSPMVFVRVDADGNPVGDIGSAKPLTEEEKIEVLARVTGKDLTVADAARLIGCDPSHIYDLQRRLADRGTLTPARRRARISQADRDAVVAFGLEHPLLGERAISTALRSRQDDPIVLSPSTVGSILRVSGLRMTVEARSAEPPPTV